MSIRRRDFVALAGAAALAGSMPRLPPGPDSVDNLERSGNARTRPTDVTHAHVLPASFRRLHRPAGTLRPRCGAGPHRRVSAGAGGGGTITRSTDLLGRDKSDTDVWGETTTTTYDLAGRPTSSNGPQGRVATTFDDGGRPLTQSLDGTLLATPTYDPAKGGDLVGATYASATGMSLVRGIDNSGRTSSLAWTKSGAGMVASHGVTYDRTGRVVYETVNGVDPYGSGANYV